MYLAPRKHVRGGGTLRHRDQCIPFFMDNPFTKMYQESLNCGLPLDEYFQTDEVVACYVFDKVVNLCIDLYSTYMETAYVNGTKISLIGPNNKTRNVLKSNTTVSCSSFVHQMI